MVSFQPTDDRGGRRRTPRNYFSRPEQYRLLVLSFSLLFVFMVMLKAAQPSTWRWMFAGEGQSDESRQSGDEDPQIDSRLKPTAVTTLPVDVFVSPLDLNTQVEDSGAPPENRWGGLTASDYAEVRDDTVFRADEADVWFRLMAALQKTDNFALDKEMIDDVGFTQLFQQPDEFRGRLVRLDGVVRRAHRLPAPDNDQGITGYWRCWLFVAGTKNPIVVYLLRMPDGFPEGMSINERVRLAGVFFKRWAYNSESGIRTAPVVVAKYPVWQPAPLTRQEKRIVSPRQLAAVMAATVCLSVLLAAFAMYWSGRMTRGRLPDDFVADDSWRDENLVGVENRTRQLLDDFAAESNSDSQESGPSN